MPAGDLAAWRVDPFAGIVQGGQLHGRGAVDMKGAIAAFVAAVARFLAAHRPAGSISLLITGDEEGPAVNGTRKLLGWLKEQGERLDACVVGEPTNPTRLGEMIKIGRRGSLTGRLTVAGIQGHAAYPERADNPIPRLLAMLAALTATPLDGGSAHFQASELVITSIDVGNQASNVIPGAAQRDLQRPLQRPPQRELARGAAAPAPGRARRPLPAPDRVRRRAVPDPAGPAQRAAPEPDRARAGRHPRRLSTSGGTSDARFIKDACPVVEFGLVGATIHQVDERVDLADLEALTRIYRALLASYVRPA